MLPSDTQHAGRLVRDDSRYHAGFRHAARRASGACVLSCHCERARAGACAAAATRLSENTLWIRGLTCGHSGWQQITSETTGKQLSEMMAREEKWILSQRYADSSRAQLNVSCALQYAAKIKRATAISLLSADPGSFKHPPFVLQVLFSSTCTECGSPPFTCEVGSAACALTVGWQQ